jgi:hypothetical protein
MAASVRMARVADPVTHRSVGSYSPDSLSAHLRRRRWERFARAFRDLADMHVLAVGGVARAWRIAGLRPAHVTLLNVTAQEVTEDWMTSVVGDACDMPSDLPTVDVVYSNAVIEHVGGIGHGSASRKAFAARRIGTGSRRRIGTSRSSRTSWRPDSSICRAPRRLRSSFAGRSGTTRSSRIGRRRSGGSWPSSCSAGRSWPRTSRQPRSNARGSWASPNR